MILVAFQSWLWRAIRQLYTATTRWEPKTQSEKADDMFYVLDSAGVGLVGGEEMKPARIRTLNFRVMKWSVVV